MAAPSLAPAHNAASRRSLPRHPIRVALDVVALQSGIPHNMPGRCCDLSEAGLGAIVAGELSAGQAVAIELRLPNVGLPVRARAQVRYQDRLRCGLQFVALPLEQREKIRYWFSQSVSPHVPADASKSETAASRPAPQVGGPSVVSEKRTRRFRVHRRHFFILLTLIAGIAAFGWWHWQTAWNDLEGEVSVNEAPLGDQPLRVSQETMDQQVIYKVDPVYPDAARRAGIQGLVVLDAVIAPDGTVKRLRPVAGPDVLAQSALDAVLSWRYTPYRVDGRAVEIETTVSYSFRLQ